VVGGWGDVPSPDSCAHSAPHSLAALTTPRPAIRWRYLFLSVIIVAAALTLLPGLGSIPPLVESDYCYLLIAAERFYNGLGLTSLQPVAPLQHWEWRYDWGYLTQWPAGYPTLIAAVRCVLGCTSLEACRLISVAGCAAAMAGWFTLIRRSVPRGVTGLLLAGVAAGSGLSVALMVNPSTDLILIAALPFVMLLVSEGVYDGQSRRLTLHLVFAGLLAGGLFWFRYASIFVPVAVGLLLVVEYFRRRLPLSSLTVFTVSAALPIAALTTVSTVYGPTSNVSTQFNLGSKVGLNLSMSALWRAWWMFSDLGFYSHRPLAHWLFALLPLLVPFVLFVKPARAALSRLMAPIEFRLALFVVPSMLGMIVGAAAIFSAKFDYIGLERYYLPARPLYFLIAFAPLMLIPRRAVRTMLCLVLLSFGSWIFFQDWTLTYSRWIQASRPSTPLGAWSRAFEPNANRLYEWVREQSQKNQKLLVFSNFHEYLAMETGIATLPIPPSAESFRNVLAKTRQLRGLENPHPIFVVNPQNLWRDYWIAPPDEIICKFELSTSGEVPPELRQYVLVPTNPPLDQAD
jgi:hypothetical protein